MSGTICGYEWESEPDEAEEEEDHGCQGQHSCCLQTGHSDLEHECDCGDTSIDDNDVIEKPILSVADYTYANNMQAMAKCLTETLE